MTACCRMRRSEISASARCIDRSCTRSSGCGAAAAVAMAIRSRAIRKLSRMTLRRGSCRASVHASVYGVVLNGDAVDAPETARLRAGDRQTGEIDFGDARREWERMHGIAAESVADWLPTLPVGVRRYAQAHVYEQLHASGPGPYDASQVARSLLGSMQLEANGSLSVTPATAVLGSKRSAPACSRAVDLRTASRQDHIPPLSRVASPRWCRTPGRQRAGRG